MIREALELTRIFKNQRLASTQLDRLQETKLRAVIQNAYEHVPYYRSLFRSAGLSPEDICTVEDLRKVPVTTKDDLRAAGLEKTTARWADLSTCVQRSTSGSTGQPFTVYRTVSEHRTAELAWMARLIWAGFRPWDRIAFLGFESGQPQRLYHRLGLYRRTTIAGTLAPEAKIQRLTEFQPPFW